MQERHPDAAGDDIDVENGLLALLEVLRQEHDALLKGDARRAAALNNDKERIADELARAEFRAGASDGSPARLAALAGDVARLAAGNHALLRHMYQHYCGMLEFLLRMTGQPATYDKGGAVAATREIAGAPRATV
ncbi:MAG: hypothetical protein PHU25_16380 [Deltaproteobacteria bacterium]|nr:hypothetical protein [Deltaproteobacteria bacterium]